ncbi:hypothetical protein ACE41H_14535 [Paenibacillus enshidis]|uniref:Uncharacterized protein n=1 Tax=Paenibacillus enshidis TaxID=1458439 RepID=A0ABV5AUT6_9BACL
MNNFSNQQPGGRQKVAQQLGGQLSSEFAQDNDVPLVAKRVQKSAQNKIQDSFKTPNEKFSSEFASETQGTLRQKAQQSKRSKVQDNYKTPNEKFDEGFDN